MTQFPHSRVYREQNASRQVVASGGTLLVEPGGTLTASGQITFGAGSSFTMDSTVTLTGLLNASLGAVALPGSLRRGYIPLTPIGVKTTATASGIVPLTTGTNPQLHNPDITSGFLRYRWTSAAGSLNPLFFAPVRVPDELATDGGLVINVVGVGASANASNELNIAVRAGTATANVGSTRALTSSPVQSTMAVTSGNTPATGLISISVFPSAHASGAIDLYSMGIAYRRRTS